MREITVGELIDSLALHPRDAIVTFGARALEFNRVKHRGQDPRSGVELVQIEFVQQVYRNSKGEVVIEDCT